MIDVNKHNKAIAFDGLIEENGLLKQRIAELARVVRLLSALLKHAREPDMIGAAADMYPYEKLEVLETAERVLKGIPAPEKGTCGHCAQPYGSRKRISELEAQVKDAFRAGYTQGHNDTVESCYCLDDELKADEYIEEQKL